MQANSTTSPSAMAAAAPPRVPSHALANGTAPPPAEAPSGRVRDAGARTRRRCIQRPCWATLPPPARLALIALLFLLAGPGEVSFASAAAQERADGAGGGGTATASAFIRYCDGGATTPAHGCARALVVELRLDDSTFAGSVLEAEVTVTRALHQSILAARGDAANTAATSLQVMLPPISVAVQRGAAYWRYGLSYLRTFPAALRDYVQVLRTAMTCDDGVTRCPAYESLSGALMQAPLGLCCLCTSVECALTTDLCNASTRTHFCFRTGAAGSICVREEGVPYNGWSVGAPSPLYTLHLSASGRGIAPSTLQLSTDAPEARDATSVLRLLQASDVSPEDTDLKVMIADRVLFVPSTDAAGATSADEGSEEDPGTWLLLPRPLVSVAGNECDKVGVTPEYIYSLSSASQCGAQFGTCVHNQLADLHAEDLVRIANGGAGRYVAATLGAFKRQKSGKNAFLLDAVQRTGGILLRWSVNADALAYTPVPVPGLLERVEYLSSTGVLSVTVRNNNTYAGSFSVAVGQCQQTRTSPCGDGGGDGVTRECVSTTVVAGANGSSLLSFHMASDATDEEGSTAACTVVLRDSASVVLSSATVSWMVAHTTTTPAPELPKAEQCRRCDFADLRCLVHTVCEWQMLLWTVVAVAVTWTPYMLVAHWRTVWQIGAKCVAWRPR